MTKTIRVGCASGFWGDSFVSAPQLVRQGKIDYLVFDYLAEITMSILARARQRDPNAGYALDFVTVTMAGLAREIAEKKIKVIANAGGVNPAACAKALEDVLAKQGVVLKVAYVEGDDVIARLDHWRAAGLTEMFEGTPLPEKPISMNCYLGGFPVARALDEGADIVITGRGVDSAVTLGACIHEFGWSPKDYDRLAGGSLAGHIVECGAQACGGVFTDWDKVPGWENIGYAIAEIAADGSFIATKPEGTGGLVSVGTVGEQMLYEIADPQAYFLPDVTADFSGVSLEQVGENRVRVAGARGLPPTATYKCSITYEDGYRVTNMVTIAGIDAGAKARRTGEAVLARMEEICRQRNWGPYEETSIEVIGDEDSYGPHRRDLHAREAILKLAAKHARKEPLEMMIRELTSCGTSFAPGTAGYGGGRPKVSPVVRHFATLIAKSDVPVTVHVAGKAIPCAIDTDGGFKPEMIERPHVSEATVELSAETVPLIRLAFARSGDKGDNSNIGVLAREREYLPYIRAALSEEAVAKWFAHKFKGGKGKVQRYELPGSGALNFVLWNALGGGGIASLAFDPQGKAYAQMLLEFPIPVPASLAKRLAA
ncbi:MAG: acyclic terpene utilization AtuA family protein [Alphaproteobacteria bacterium]|nr:acyclic terpene utilization AtuA family protein [Alphaproteobacteria bacterium]